jgi:long-chain acyl-CoA synthetase
LIELFITIVFHGNPLLFLQNYDKITIVLKKGGSPMDRPWLAHYADVPHHLEYPQGSISDAFFATAARLPHYEALSFMGRRISYAQFAKKVEQACRAFAALGIRKGERIMLCLPNVPQAVTCLYALNRLGAVE